MLEHLPELFEKKNSKKTQDIRRETDDLQRKVGQLTMEVDFLEKKCKQLGIPVKDRNS
ncbi:MAG: transposase [Desulforhopalus sp.]|jgi:transposase